jgi:hypothetical protein
VHFAFDVSRLRQALGEWPLKDFEDGVREQYEHHLRSGRKVAHGAARLPGCS